MGKLWFNSNPWRRATYTLWSPMYDRFVTPLFHAKRRRALTLLHPVPGQRVLILGAGTGLDLEFLDPHLQITAIDITPAMVRRLHARATQLGQTVDARVMDGQVLDFPAACFDAVILHLILAVIPDPVASLRETARVLRPGGRAVILDKFHPDGTRPPWILRWLNPLFRLGGTEITRQLGPLLAGLPFRMVHEEAAGFHGFLKIVLVERL